MQLEMTEFDLLVLHVEKPITKNLEDIIFLGAFLLSGKRKYVKTVFFC